MGTFQTILIFIIATVMAVAFDECNSPKTEKEMPDERTKEMLNEEITDVSETYKKNKYTIHMEVIMERDMSYEEAEKVIFDALRNAGMKGHKGGIS